MARPAAPTALPPFSRSLPMQLLRAREAVMQRFRPHLRGHDMTDQQWRVIRVLAEVDEAEMQDLARFCQVHPPSLSRLVPKLEQRGLLRRQPASADGRRMLVRITPQGRALLHRAGAESERIYAALTAQVGADRLDALSRALDGLVAALDGVPGGVTGPGGAPSPGR